MSESTPLDRQHPAVAAVVLLAGTIFLAGAAMVQIGVAWHIIGDTFTPTMKVLCLMALPVGIGWCVYGAVRATQLVARLFGQRPAARAGLVR